jgi:CheY-like chemotaxis protein
MDMELPDVDGVKTNAMLKQNPKTAHVPELVAEGSPQNIVEQYLPDVSLGMPAPLGQRKDRQGSAEIQFSEVSILDTKAEALMRP